MAEGGAAKAAAAVANMEDDVYAIIRESLTDAILSKSARKPSDQSVLRVKLEYLREKRSVQMKRPVLFLAFQNKIREMYGRQLAIYYTVTNSEIIVPIRNQEELQRAVDLVDKSTHMRSLRLLLSQHSDAPLSPPERSVSDDVRRLEAPAIPECSESGRFSPPPGRRSTAGRSRRNSRSSIASSRHSGDGVSHRSLAGVVEVPYVSTASSRASSKVSLDGCCAASSAPLGGRMRWQDELCRSRHRWSAGSGAHHGSRASSSSSSGLVPDMDSSLDGRRVSATSPRAPTNWRQGRCLGAGAFGQVYLAYDADTGRELAAKRVLLRFDPADRAIRKEVASLENEIVLLKNMQHERIVQYFGFQRDTDALTIFMEYMPGGSVKDEIRQYGPLKETVAKKYTRQILEGLNYLHHYDVVHRDIKSSNILRDGDGNVKIADFGSGKRLQTICSQSAAGTFIGTPYYMAPEIVQGKRYGRKADIWSLGCTLLEMLTGRPPWKQLEPMAAIFRIAFEQPQYELPASVSAPMVALLALLFSRPPDERPHAYEALQHAAVQRAPTLP